MKLTKFSSLYDRETHGSWLILFCLSGFVLLEHNKTPTPYYGDSLVLVTYGIPVLPCFSWFLTTFAIYILFKMMRRRDNCGAFRLAMISAFATPCLSQLNNTFSALNVTFLVHTLLLHYLSGGGYRFRPYWIGFFLGSACILHPGFLPGAFIFFHLLYVKEGKRFFARALLLGGLTFGGGYCILPHYSFLPEWDLHRDPLETLWNQWFSPESGLFFYCPFLCFGITGIIRVFKSDSTFHIYLILFLIAEILIFATFPRYLNPPFAQIESLLLYPYLLVFLHLQWRILWQRKLLRGIFAGAVLLAFYFQCSALALF